jgi:hypothetical protein
MSEPALLTIWVLAYENSSCVQGLLKSLLPLTTDLTRILVSDNSDQTDAVEQLCQKLGDGFGGRLTYVKNVVNLGGLGNILRAFEACQTPYLWIVGACNEFVPGSLDVVLNSLKTSRPDCLMIFENNLWRRAVVTEARTYTEYASLLEDHSYSVLCSINSMIYSTAAFQKYLGFGYEAGSSLVPHTAMILAGLRSREICVLYIPVHAIMRLVRPRQWSMRKFVRHLTAVFPGHVPEAEYAAFLKDISRTDKWLLAELRRLEQDPDYGYSRPPNEC